MPLNIKNPEVERLAGEVAAMAGETKTEAIRKALVDRKQRLSFQVVSRDRRGELLTFLEREVWPHVPPEVIGSTISREREDEILGYGPSGA